jgi:Tol biopolymer transport system component
VRDRFPSIVPALCAVGVAAGLSACDRAEPAARAEAAAPEPLVVFSSQRDGNDEIYLMRLDGSDPVRLTFHTATDLRPDLSPDGRWVVFESDRSGHTNIYKLSLDGGEPISLTSSPDQDKWARWSPDGQRIAFHRVRVEGADADAQIYLVNADGTGVTRLTDHPGLNLWPEWSPDGARLSFRRGTDLWVMNADGTQVTQLTDAPGVDQMASWSPDGQRLAFFRERGGYCAIHVMNADGSDPINLTPKDEGDADVEWCSGAPSWLPDGRILFSSMRPATGGDWEIFLMNDDGSGLTRLTHTPGNDWSPRPAIRR